MDPKSVRCFALANNVVFLVLCCLFSTALSDFNVMDFGAKADGRTDSARAFLAAWAKTCGANKAATMVVPSGEFLVSRALFQGPCNNKQIQISVKGTVVGNSAFSSADEWITFKYVMGLSILGGSFDARGQSLWACKAAGRSCPTGSTALTISQSKNVLIRGVEIKNSQNFQMSIKFSQGVMVDKATITAPADSPNTDGIHIHMSSGVTITGSTVATGDDCISIGEGVTNAWIERIMCGPGHGISIGSLGGGAGEAAVRNVTVTSAVFTGTQNGFRIKTWAAPFAGSVNKVTFQHATMNNVQNPIIIDQNYCPSGSKCPNQSSGVKISEVTFDDVHGTSTTPVAVKLDCSKSNPCQGIQLTNINLSYNNGKTQQLAQSICANAKGMSSGRVVPPSCL